MWHSGDLLHLQLIPNSEGDPEAFALMEIYTNVCHHQKGFVLMVRSADSDHTLISSCNIIITPALGHQGSGVVKEGHEERQGQRQGQYNTTDRRHSHLAVVCGKDHNPSRAGGHGAGEVLLILP